MITTARYAKGKNITTLTSCRTYKTSGTQYVPKKGWKRTFIRFAKDFCMDMSQIEKIISEVEAMSCEYDGNDIRFERARRKMIARVFR